MKNHALRELLKQQLKKFEVGATDTIKSSWQEAWIKRVEAALNGLPQP